MRTLVDIPEQQIEALAVICGAENKSRSEIIRLAIAAYVEQHAPAPVNVFGLWKNKPVDGLVYQQTVRSEW